MCLIIFISELHFFSTTKCLTFLSLSEVSLEVCIIEKCYRKERQTKSFNLTSSFQQTLLHVR